MKNVFTNLSQKHLKSILAVLALALPMLTFADESNKVVTDANVVGHLVDKKTHEHLPYINVYVMGTMIQTSTDRTGHYMLKDLTAGKHTIEVRGTGYRTTRKEVNIKPQETVELNFEVDQDVISLDEVVVSSNRNLSLRRNAAALVNVLGKKTFDVTQSNFLAQGLNFQPGVRTEDNCQNCGFSQVRINGLDGHYSQILLDSRPVFSALQGIYGLEQIPANMIERVEIVRGGGSALYGSSAIGGTINIITKEPLVNFAEMGHTFMALGGNKAYENVTTMNASVVADNHKAGLYVYGQSHARQGYDHNGDGYTELPKLITKSIGLSSFLRLSDWSKLKLQYHSITEFRRGGDNLDVPAHEAHIAEMLDHNVNGGNLTYDMFTPDEQNRFKAYLSFESVQRKSFYGGIGEGTPEDSVSARKAYSVTRELNLVGGAQYVHSFKNLLFMPADMTFGVEHSYDKLHDHSLGYDDILAQEVNNTSAYFQNEWKNDQLTILLGGRLDKHNMVKRLIFSPRVNLRYNVTPDINLRASYAGGFRAPQAFDEDLHTGLAGGQRYVIRLADGLKEERSNSFNLSADTYHKFGNLQANLLVEGFFTTLNNIFALKTTEETNKNGDKIQYRYNADNGKVYGVNIEGKLAFGQLAQLQAGFTAQKSLYNEDIEVFSSEDGKTVIKDNRMLRTPDTYGYFIGTVTPVRHFNVSLSGNYTGSLLAPHLQGSGAKNPSIVKPPSFFTLSTKLAYDFELNDLVKIEVNGGIQNMTNAYQKDLDTGALRDADYIYGPNMPRTFYMGIKIAY